MQGYWQDSEVQPIKRHKRGRKAEGPLHRQNRKANPFQQEQHEAPIAHNLPEIPKRQVRVSIKPAHLTPTMIAEYTLTQQSSLSSPNVLNTCKFIHNIFYFIIADGTR